jgi:AraC-like DNA-binding protein
MSHQRSYDTGTIYSRELHELTNINFQNDHQTNRAINTKRYIDENFHNPISLERIAHAVHCSRFHLNREFKRLYGMTPGKYLKENVFRKRRKYFGIVEVLPTHVSVLVTKA